MDPGELSLYDLERDWDRESAHVREGGHVRESLWDRELELGLDVAAKQDCESRMRMSDPTRSEWDRRHDANLKRCDIRPKMACRYSYRKPYKV
jgi:hypothetical protein